MVEIVNVAELLPAATVTEEGTVASAEVLDRVTTDPPVGAGPVSVTVPVEEDPPVTVEGFKDSPPTAAGRTESTAFCTEDPCAAVIVAE